MEKYSVWYMPYNKKYLITHPWQWVKCAWRCCRDAWRRSVYGWTYSDVWDWDNWFLHVAPEMLRYLADHGSAYPGSEPFDTPEKWHEWLHENANLLESGREDWQDARNEYYNDYMKYIISKWEPWKEDKETKFYPTKENTTILKDKFFERSHELEKQGIRNIRFALSRIGEHFSSLWD